MRVSAGWPWPRAWRCAGTRSPSSSRRRRHGGKLGRYARDGFVFDTGPSLLTLPAVFRELFAKTGGALEDSVELVEPDPGVGYRFADGTVAELPRPTLVGAPRRSATRSAAPRPRTGGR